MPKQKPTKKKESGNQKAARKALLEFIDRAKEAGLPDKLLIVRASDLTMRAKK